MEVMIEMNLDQITLARTVYTTLDVLSDVGGIQSILMSAMGLFLGIWNYRNFDNYMAQRLYKVKRTDDQVATDLERTYFLNIYEWFLDSLPNVIRCKHCCRKSQKMREM